MKLELYPAFETVFADEQLKGIFYPLCAIELNDDENTKLFFVSSNGIWTNENNSSENNSNTYTKFNLVEKKYKFNGNIELYNGHKYSKAIIKELETDFEENGKKYLETKTKTDTYINQIKQTISLPENTALDVDYYIQTFYEYAINKLNYQLHNEFGAFRAVIDNWGKADEKSPVVYEVSSNNNSGFADIAVNAAYLFPKSINLSNYEKIGQIVGSEFFADGNDSTLLYNKNEQTVLCINSYS